MLVLRSRLVLSWAMLVTVACGGATVEHAARTKPEPHATSDGGYPDADNRSGDICSVSVCVANRCPVALVTDAYPTAMAVAAGKLEWLGVDGVMSMPVTGGTPTTIWAGSTASLAVDPAAAYFTTRDESLTNVISSTALEKVSLDGGMPTTLASFMITRDGLREIFLGRFPSSGPHAIAVDATNAYLVTSPSGDTTDLSKNVVKVPLSGGSPITISSPMTDPIAVDATRLYGFDGTHALVAVPLEGGAPTVFAPPHARISTVDFAVDATSVYWAEQELMDCPPSSSTFSCTTSRIWKSPIHGYTAPTLVASGQYSIWDISVDETSVYWVALDAGGIGIVMKVPLEGGTPTLLASASSSECWGNRIAVDATSVYWNWGSTILRLTPK